MSSPPSNTQITKGATEPQARMKNRVRVHTDQNNINIKNQGIDKKRKPRDEKKPHEIEEISIHPKTRQPMNIGVNPFFQ